VDSVGLENCEGFVAEGGRATITWDRNDPLMCGGRTAGFPPRGHLWRLWRNSESRGVSRGTMADNSTGALSIGQTIATAVVASLIAYIHITMITLTASYVMNRSIYRHWLMRLFTGILAVLTSVLTFWIVLFFMPKTRYFGFFPLIEGGGSGGERTGWWDRFVGGVWDSLTRYFQSSYDPSSVEDRGALQEIVRASLGWTAEVRHGGEKWWVNASSGLEYRDGADGPTGGVVNEALNEAARVAGAIASEVPWKRAMDEIARGNITSH
jgi:hypothetical protein